MLIKGTTILGIVLATDRTHLTNFTGDKKMHAVLETSVRRFEKDKMLEPGYYLQKYQCASSQKLASMAARQNRRQYLAFWPTVYFTNA